MFRQNARTGLKPAAYFVLTFTLEAKGAVSKPETAPFLEYNGIYFQPLHTKRLKIYEAMKVFSHETDVIFTFGKSGQCYSHSTLPK